MIKLAFVSYLPRMGGNEAKTRDDWTREELELLSRLAKDRVSAAQAAKLLGRRISSVRRQARQLGIILYRS
jgi:hypothetical protein